MRSDSRWLVVFLGNLVFLFIVTQLNNHLTRVPLGPVHGPVYLFLLGLPVAFAALRLRLKQGLAAVIPTALAAEAGTPLPPGTLMLASAACLCVTIAVRGNFNRFDLSSAILTGLGMNLVIAMVITALIRPSGGVVGGVRLIVDLLISQAFLAALTGWFFSAQMALLRLFGINLETELREPL
jgi:hypothetical protein